MNDILLHMHMGLGDHLVCSGLVKKISQENKNKKIYLAVRDSIKKNVELLYSEEERIIPTNIPFYPKDNENYRLDDINSPWIRSCKMYAEMNDLDLMTVGYYKYFHSNPWDINFYMSQNIDYEAKYRLFSIPKLVQEEAIKKFDNIVKPIVENKDFIFIHDDPSRNFHIKHKSDKIILRNTDEVFKNFNIFDMIPILEKASELHMIGSSLICLCDLLKIYNTERRKCYYYYSVRGLSTWRDIDKWNLL